jgi:hypothetical protein
MRKRGQRKQSDQVPIRARLRAKRESRRRHRIEKSQWQATELRHRDEHTGGYGDPPL